MVKESDISEINFSLDSYEDLFSDFDPRPYSKKALSDDFLSEAKRAVRDKIPERIDLKLFVSKKKRNFSDEFIIKRRLREHFKKHYELLKDERNKIIKKGIMFISIGIILMLVATSVLFYQQGKSFFISLIIVVLEPSGWFLFWEGLNLVVFNSKEQNPHFEFYKKMVNCRISFFDI